MDNKFKAVPITDYFYIYDNVIILTLNFISDLEDSVSFWLEKLLPNNGFIPFCKEDKMSISPSSCYISLGICLLVTMFSQLSPFRSSLSNTFINAELTDDPITCGSFLKLSSMVGTGK